MNGGDSIKEDAIERSVADIGTGDVPTQPSALAVAERDEIEITALRQKVEDRKRYAPWIFRITVVWLFVTLLLIVLSGYQHSSWAGYFPRLSDGVLIALVSGMSASVIGLLAIMLKHLFPSRE